MRFASSLFILVLGGAIFAAGFALAANKPKPGRTEEVVFGSFDCSSSVAGGGDVFLEFEASGDIASELDFSDIGFPPLLGDAEAICAELVPEAIASAQAAGCTTGPVESSSSEFGDRQNFGMVCSGARSRMIELIADLGRLAIGANA